MSFAVPENACDCHVHVYLDRAAYPMAPDRTFTPPPIGADELDVFQKRLGCQRTVVVQPSTYGDDNRATLKAVEALGLKRARAVVVLPENVSPADIDRLHAAGARGARINLAMAGNDDPVATGAKVREVAAKLAGRNWHVEIFASLTVLAAIKSVLETLPVPVAIDHLGNAVAARGLAQNGFPELLEMVRGGNVYVKLSGIYRASSVPDYTDVTPLICALIAANPQRMLWGSNWPHVDTSKTSGKNAEDIASFHPIDDRHVMSLMPQWAPDAATQKLILVDNAARIHDF